MPVSSSIKYFIMLMLAAVISFSVFAQNIPARPNPPRLVNDFTGVLSAEQKNILEQKLVALDDSTSNQIAIVLIKTLDDYPIEDYSNKLLRSWGIGTKKNNNGLLIVAAIDDHKVRIEVGYGLEGAIPDITANSIVEDDIVPSFKTENYYQGLNAATDDLGKAAAGEYHVQRQQDDDSDSKGSGVGFGIIIIVFIIILIISRRGGGGGGMMSRRGYGGLGPFILGNIIGSSFGGGRGGDSGGGWSGGGGGGFGGFGGGSSGGGGASGSW